MDYVVGFQFNRDGDRVALIRKRRPEWQSGFWNGIGGKVELGEPPETALWREFKEETGVPQDHIEWLPFVRLETWTKNRVFCYSSFTDQVELIRSVTDEPVDIFSLVFATSMTDRLVHDVPWLVSMALSRFHRHVGGDGRELASYMVVMEMPPKRGELESEAQRDRIFSQIFGHGR